MRHATSAVQSAEVTGTGAIMTLTVDLPDGSAHVFHLAVTLNHDKSTAPDSAPALRSLLATVRRSVDTWGETWALDANRQDTERIVGRARANADRAAARRKRRARLWRRGAPAAALPGGTRAFASEASRIAEQAAAWRRRFARG